MKNLTAEEQSLLFLTGGTMRYSTDTAEIAFAGKELNARVDNRTDSCFLPECR